MARPLISRSGDHVTISSVHGRRRFLFWLALSSVLAVGLIVLGVAADAPVLVVFGALFALMAIATLGAMPTALKPTTLKGGVLSVPRFGVGQHATRTIDLGTFAYAGVTGRWQRERQGRTLLWDLVVWHDAHQPMHVPGDYPVPRGGWSSVLASLHEGDEVLLQSELGKVASLLDGEIQSRRPASDEPTAGRVRGYLPPGCAVVWIPSLGAAFDDGSSRNAPPPSS